MDDRTNLIEREKFIIKLAKHVTPGNMIRYKLLEQEGFVPVGRSRIYHILKKAGVKPLEKRNRKIN